MREAYLADTRQVNTGGSPQCSPSGKHASSRIPNRDFTIFLLHCIQNDVKPKCQHNLAVNVLHCLDEVRPL